MTISLENAGKRYNRDWIFKSMNYQFESNSKYALLGPNGSGKSTLLKAISGYLRLSEGDLNIKINGQIQSVEEVYRYFSICAPYIDLIEDLTVEEHVHFHGKFKNWVDGIDEKEAIHLLGFEKHRNKLVKELSSGMRQRLKLMVTIGSEGEALLLDEPATNLDRKGVAWYHQLLRNHQGDRLVVIASNREDEYEMCEHFLQMEDYK